MKMIDDDAREEYVPLGATQSVILSATVVFSPMGPASPGEARWLMVQADAQDIRFTLSGANPTATTGFHLTKSGEIFYIPIRTGTVPRFLAETAGAILNYQWMK